MKRREVLTGAAGVAAVAAVAASPTILFAANVPVIGDLRIVGREVEKFDGWHWTKWCPCMDKGLPYCGWK